MKTLILTLALLTVSLSSVFAGGARSGLARHHQAVYENNTVIFGNQVGAGATYTWQQENGPSSAKLIGQQTPTLIAANLEMGTYVFALTTTDAQGNATTDRIVVRVKDPATVTKF